LDLSDGFVEVYIEREFAAVRSVSHRSLIDGSAAV
jgi:hypothetical protein